MARALEVGIPGWLIPDYWFMLTLAIIAASLMTLFPTRRTGKTLPVADLLFYGIIRLFVGARFLYAWQYGFHRSRFLELSGLSLYGGLLGLVSTWLLYHLVRPYSLWKFLDYAAPGLALGLFLGRIGCFLAGCNGGLAVDCPGR